MYIQDPYMLVTWWRHRTETFSVLLAICAGNSPVTGEFPTQRPVTRSFDIFFDLCLNKPLSKQSWGWWFETPSRSLWRHCNDSRCRWHDLTPNGARPSSRTGLDMFFDKEDAVLWVEAWLLFHDMKCCTLNEKDISNFHINTTWIIYTIYTNESAN